MTKPNPTPERQAPAQELPHCPFCGKPPEIMSGMFARCYGHTHWMRHAEWSRRPLAGIDNPEEFVAKQKAEQPASLPTWEDCEHYMENTPRCVTALHQFIYDNEPVEEADLLRFRQQLANALSEAVEQRKAESENAGVEALKELLFAVENADETGYVTDVGFLDLEAIYEKARAALATLTQEARG